MPANAMAAPQALLAALRLLRREFAVCVVFSLVANLLMVTPALYMMQLFDRVMQSGSDFTLYVLTAVMLFFLAVMAFAEWSRARLLVRTGVKLDKLLSSRVFNASFQSQMHAGKGDPVQAFSDLTQVRQFLTGAGLFAFLDAPWSIFYIGVLFLLHPWLGWLSIAFTLILAMLAHLGHRLSLNPLEQSQSSQGQLNAFILSKLKNADTIEAMGMLPHFRKRWFKLHAQHLQTNHAAQNRSSQVQAFSKFVRYAQQSLSLGVGALLVLRGELSPVSIFAANILMGRATAPIDALVSSWGALFAARKSYGRLAVLLDANPQPQAIALTAKPAGRLRLQGLVAHAPGRSAPILKGISADFAAGQVVAILGPSGSGKTTLARCLVGIWPAYEGLVQLDGDALDHWSRDSLGPYIGYLPQDIQFSEGTIAENIARFGIADTDKVLAATQLSGVHDMILRLPRGYDTEMGEAGGFLSGGQRQRMGLARAIYGRPSLIVLDEPNSNLDNDGELALMAVIKQLKAFGSTVIFITHRTNIVSLADRVVTLDDGRILHEAGGAQTLSPVPHRLTVVPPAPLAQPV